MTKKQYQEAYRLCRLLREFDAINDVLVGKSEFINWNIRKIEIQLDINPCGKSARLSLRDSEFEDTYADYLWLYDHLPDYLAWNVQRAFKGRRKTSTWRDDLSTHLKSGLIAQPPKRW